jgi:hypothetical protein
MAPFMGPEAVAARKHAAKPTYHSFSDFDKCVGHLALVEVG